MHYAVDRVCVKYDLHISFVSIVISFSAVVTTQVFAHTVSDEPSKDGVCRLIP